ncbi:hypothetical protein [Sneathiella sp.]|uniref:hypothetical protein n=1 Tax=Sneathiella sp. TaxID=1964365 RepID=UPI002FE1B50A
MYKQFLCARDLPSRPEGFHRWTFRDWNIWTSPELPVSKVTDKSGNDIGLLLGWVIYNGIFINSHSEIRIEAIPTRENNPFHAMCGRFVVFCHFNEKPSLLTDAGALFPVVYDKYQEVIASSSMLIPGTTLLNRDPRVIETLDISKERGWYPFGLTAHANIRRLLPNHALDLSNFASTRVWPLEHETEYRQKNTLEDSILLEKICSSLANRVKTLAETSPTIMHLTGGWDTRMMLSAARHCADQIMLRTFRTEGSGGQLDQLLAKELVKKFNLVHAFVDLLPISDTERNAWQFRTGYCLNDHVIDLATTEKSISNGEEFSLSGAAGEVARAFYWGPHDLGKPQPGADALLQRLGLKHADIFLKEAEIWLENLPVGGASWTYDLAYIELRLGCWAGVAMTGHDMPYPSISPFNSVDTFQKMMSFSDAYRANGALCEDITKKLWPELLSIPVNRAPGLRKLRFIRQELSSAMPLRVKEKIKKLLKK